MQNIPGAAFNAYFYNLICKLFLMGQNPDNIMDNDDTAKVFIERTIDAIGFVSKMPTPKGYKNLFIKSYKDEKGSFLYIELPDASKDSDSKVLLLMNVLGTKKFYTVEKLGDKFYTCEYTNSSKSTSSFMISEYNDAVELYFSLTGTVSELIS
jgi:hypothetical protein